MCGINIGVSVRFRSKELGTRVKDRTKSFLALVSFLARSKPKVPFLGLSLLRNQTETLATQAMCDRPCLIPVRRLPRPSRSMYPAR